MDQFRCGITHASPTPITCSQHDWLFPRLRFEEELSSNGRSVIHKGRRKHSIEFLAIKSTVKSSRQQVIDEVRLMHAINHENIVKFHSWYETSNHLWVISEYCAGGSLRRLIEQDSALPEATVLSIGLDVLAALECVHREGFAMVELRPESFLLTEYGIAKLARFRKVWMPSRILQRHTTLRAPLASASVQPPPCTPPQARPFGDPVVSAELAADSLALNYIAPELLHSGQGASPTPAAPFRAQLTTPEPRHYSS
jgi:serine/threonine protein kinase